jgi:hypothetical protein
MSLLSSFIQNQLLKALEAEFLTHTPDVQQFLAQEASQLANQMLQWAENKLDKLQPQPKE